MTTTRGEAALQYAARDWPVLPLQLRSKRPVTEHGVLDARSSEYVVQEWWSKGDWNVGIATGSPGPDVLDVDDPAGGADVVQRCRELCIPEVRTARGYQFYFAGTEGQTVSTEYGELRRRGSYVVAPPSVHPTGHVYVWAESYSAHNPPPLPEGLVTSAPSLGCGVSVPRERVPHGQRNKHLADFAVRLNRGGIHDEATILWHLEAEFHRICEPLPAPAPGSIAGLAKRFSRTRLADAARVDDWSSSLEKPITTNTISCGYSFPIGITTSDDWEEQNGPR